MIIKAGTYRLNDKLPLFIKTTGFYEFPLEFTVTANFTIDTDNKQLNSGNQIFEFTTFCFIVTVSGSNTIHNIGYNPNPIDSAVYNQYFGSGADYSQYWNTYSTALDFKGYKNADLAKGFGQIFTVTKDTDVDDTFGAYFTENTKPYSNNFIGEIIMENTFFNYNESQAKTGYKAAVLYKKQGDTKYRFLCASETVPFPYGTKDTFEYDLLNSSSKGMVEGKNTLEQKEVELLYTPNNAYLFETLKGQVLDFMSLTPDMIGYKYHGKISFRPNDASADIHRGTYTITPMGASEVPYFMARTECYEPLFFADVIPYTISMSELDTTETSIKLNLGLVGDYKDAKYTYDTFSAITNRPSGTRTALTVESGVGNIAKTTGLYIIYADPAEADVNKYSGCFTLVYVTD